MKTNAQRKYENTMINDPAGLAVWELIDSIAQAVSIRETAAKDMDHARAHAPDTEYDRFLDWQNADERVALLVNELYHREEKV